MTWWQDSTPVAPPETPFREPKDVAAKVIWEIPLEVEGERPLLHVCINLSEDVLGWWEMDKHFVLLPQHHYTF